MSTLNKEVVMDLEKRIVDLEEKIKGLIVMVNMIWSWKHLVCEKLEEFK